MERFLNRLRALGDLGDADVAAVAETTFDVVAVRSDTDLTRAGEPVDLLHVLAEGWAFRNILLQDGRRQIPALYLPGDLCELDALAADRLDCSITTLVPCRVARLGKAALSAAIRRRAEVGRAFLALACRENALLTQWNVALGRKSAREHVAHSSASSSSGSATGRTRAFGTRTRSRSRRPSSPTPSASPPST